MEAPSLLCGARERAARTLLLASRGLFAAFFASAMLSSSWTTGLFARLPLASLHIAGRRVELGPFVLIPMLAAWSWAAARLLAVQRHPWRRGPAHVAVPVICFGALALLRSWPVHEPKIAVVSVVAVGLFWGAYLYALQDWPSKWLVGSLCVVLAVQGTIAVLQFLLQRSVGLGWWGELVLTPEGQGVSVIGAAGRRWLRAYGLFSHPNMLGGYLSMDLLVCLGAVVRTRRSLRPLHWACLAAGALGLLVTFSRAAWLGMVVGLAYLGSMTGFLRRLRQDARSRRLALILTGVGVGLGIVFLTLYGELLFTRFFRLSSPLEATSIQERLVDARQAWGLIRAVPIKGTGTGYYIPALWAGVGEDRPPGFRKVHSAPLLVAAELGIGGALIWLWMVSGPAVVLLRMDRDRRSLFLSGMAAACVAALVVGLFDYYFYPASNWWSALYLGVLLGVWARLWREPVEENPW